MVCMLPLLSMAGFTLSHTRYIYKRLPRICKNTRVAAKDVGTMCVCACCIAGCVNLLLIFLEKSALPLPSHFGLAGGGGGEEETTTQTKRAPIPYIALADGLFAAARRRRGVRPPVYEHHRRAPTHPSLRRLQKLPALPPRWCRRLPLLCLRLL